MFARVPSQLGGGLKFGRARDVVQDGGYQSDSPLSGKGLSRPSKRSVAEPLRKEVLMSNVSRHERRDLPLPPMLPRPPPLPVVMPPPLPQPKRQHHPFYDDDDRVKYGLSGEVIHINYDLRSPPVLPADKVRFVCISDTHGKTFEVPDGDVLLHTGDLSSGGTFASLYQTFQWLKGLPHQWKL